MIARIALVTSLAAVLGTGAVAAPALAQGSASGQFGISPARRDLVGRPPIRLVPTQVTNTTQAGFDVSVFPVLLSQAPTGDFVFSEKHADLNAANNILTPSPRSFHLDPGQSRTVSLQWNTLPPHARAAYVGVVFQGIPVINGKRNLKVTDRLLSVNFLRLPGRYRASGRFTGLQVTQAPVPKVLRFLPRVKNTGDVVDSPKHTSLVVEDASGRHLYRQSWTGDVVLPGVQRDFPIDVKHVFAAGDYTAVAVMDFGSSKHQVVRSQFHLTAPNTLPSPDIAITAFGGNGVIGQPAHLSAQVASTGTAPVSTRVSIQLYHVTGGPGDATPVASTRLRYTDLAPGQRRGLDARLGKVVAGHYRAVLRYRDPTNIVRSLSAEFDATKQRSFLDRLRRFFREHGVVAVGLLALLLLLVIVVWFVRRQRRLERALAEREAMGATSVPAVPAAPLAPAEVAVTTGAPVAAAEPVAVADPPVTDEGPPVDINTATVEELQRLPGVGPRAAERIVEHREEYGQFASVDGLAAVKGFGPARVAGLRDRATT